MKNLYVCEMCGKTFTDYDAAWNCEYSHCNVGTLHPWELPQNSNLPLTVYEEGDAYPKYIVLKGEVRDADGTYVTETLPDGTLYCGRKAVCYMRLDVAPKCLPRMDEYTNGMLTRAIADNLKEDEEG